jgi:hypothetical protein
MELESGYSFCCEDEEIRGFIRAQGTARYLCDIFDPGSHKIEMNHDE